MKNLDKIPILTWMLWLGSLAIRLAGFDTLAGAFFLLGWMWVYWRQRPSVQKNRKLYDTCALIVTIFSIATILSLTVEAIIRSS
ncbi:MAG: hypothetical protein V4760_03365 [Bdellovibrionota bacterium]